MCLTYQPTFGGIDLSFFLSFFHFAEWVKGGTRMGGYFWVLR